MKRFLKGKEIRVVQRGRVELRLLNTPDSHFACYVNMISCSTERGIEQDLLPLLYQQR